MAKPSYYTRRAELMAAFNGGDPNWRRFRTGKAEQRKPDRLVPAVILKKLGQRVIRYRRANIGD